MRSMIAHVLNQLGHLAHQPLVIDLGEEGGDVGIHDPAEALVTVLHDAADGLIDRAPAAIGEAAVLDSASKRGVSTSAAAVCSTRSRTAGTASWRGCLPGDSTTMPKSGRGS